MKLSRIVGIFLATPGSFLILTLVLNKISMATSVGMLPLVVIMFALGVSILCLIRD